MVGKDDKDSGLKAGIANSGGDLIKNKPEKKKSKKELRKEKRAEKESG